jgi:hypothetical protein
VCGESSSERTTQSGGTSLGLEIESSMRLSVWLGSVYLICRKSTFRLCPRKKGSPKFGPLAVHQVFYDMSSITRKWSSPAVVQCQNRRDINNVFARTKPASAFQHWLGKQRALPLPMSMSLSQSSPISLGSDGRCRGMQFS